MRIYRDWPNVPWLPCGWHRVSFADEALLVLDLEKPVEPLPVKPGDQDHPKILAVYLFVSVHS
jgi:hypothetical protein